MSKILRRLELLFRHAVVYPVFRLLFRNAQSDQRIDIRSIRRLLILRYDRIGDIIVTTPIFRKLKAVNPSLNIGVVASPANASIISHDPHVDDVFILDKNWLRMIGDLGKARGVGYEVVLNFIFNRTTSGGIIANFVAPDGFKVGQGAEKYRFYFNRLLQLSRGSKHMVEVLADYVEQVFGLPFTEDELAFRIEVDDASQRQVDTFLYRHGLSRRGDTGKRGDGFVVFNLSATDEVRRLSHEQVTAITSHLSITHGVPTVLISAPADSDLLSDVKSTMNTLRCQRYPEAGSATLLEIASLIGGALCVITPDTSIIHFASAMKTPVMGLFTPLQVTNEWLPYKVESRIVLADEGNPVSKIPEERILSAIDSFVAVYFPITSKRSSSA